MKIKPVLIRLALLFPTLLPAGALLADEVYDLSDTGSKIRVDVVVDMTEAGHKITHPTPDRPAYYLPLSVGYKEFGYAHDFQRPPPKEWDIQHALAIALYNEGYRLMTKQGHPSLVLVFWWGYMVPESIDMDSPNGVIDRPGSLDGGDAFYWGSGQMKGKPPGDNFVGGSTGVLPAFTMLSIGANDAILSSMVGGNTINDHQKFLDPRLDAAMQLTTQARYYVLISAFDFHSWLHHKTVLLWRAHVSTELWGHYFDQVVGTLITTAAPQFGRETKVPHFINSDITPLGRVVVGTPVVKDYETEKAK